MLDARFSHLYFYQSLNRLQRGLSAIAELLVIIARSLWTDNAPTYQIWAITNTSLWSYSDLKVENAVQGHPRSPNLVPIESSYATSY